MTFRFVQAFCLLFIVSLPASASFDSAVEAYEAGNFTVAYTEFRRLAELGDASSQRNLAAMYARGEYVEKDLIEAWAWASLAAEQGGDGSAELQQALDTRLAPEQRTTATVRLAELQRRFGKQALAEKLLPVPAERNADCSVDVLSDAKPIETKAPRYPIKALRDGVEGYACASFYLSVEGKPVRIRLYQAEAVLKLSKKPYEDQTVFVNEVEKVLPQWRFMPAATEDLRSSPNRYCVDFKLDGLTRKEAKAEQAAYEVNRDAALSGDPVAQYRLMEQLESLSAIRTLTVNQRQEMKTKAQSLLLQSAVGGHDQSQYRLAKNLLTGNQCEKDIGKGVTWLTFAAQQGHAEAQYLLSSRLRYGDGVQSNPDKALFWLKAAAESKHPRATIDYALHLLRHEPARQFEALALLPKMPNSNDLRELEAVALAKARIGDFNTAATYQEMALAIASEIGLDATNHKAVLDQYRQQQTPDPAGMP